MKFKSVILIALGFAVFAGSVATGTILISPTGDGGFETGTDFPGNGWTVVNEANNRLFVGSAPVPSAGARCAFSSSNSSTWTGEAFANVNHFYRDIAFPAGETNITLTFKYKVVNPDSSGDFDNWKVYLAPTSTTPVAGTQVSSSFQVGAARYDTATSYTLITITLPSTAAGTTQRLIFSWKTDGVSPHAAGAMDEISLVSLGPVNGTKTVGPTGDYATLTAAFADLTSRGVNGATILELQNTYISTGETFPLVVGNITGNSATNTITVRPAAGATNLSISSSNATAALNLNGAKNVTFDGRPGGAGVTSQLTISDTATTSGVATIQFINDASNNTIQYCTISGSGTSTTSGTVFFSTGTSTGNVSDTISNCTINAAGSNLSTNAIYSAGSSTSITNNTISITNNNIQDYYNAGAASNGILVASNSASWTISGNKFFQTATRTATSGNLHCAINIITASGGGYTISSNTIGFASAAGTGTTTYAGSFASRFSAIELTAAATPVSNIQGNTINAISLSTNSGASTAGSGIWQGITIRAGGVNVGTTTGNTIGATSGTGSISITSTTSLGYIAGIYATSSSAVTISNNNIGSISTGGTAAIGYTFAGIDLAGNGSHTATSNIIGNSTANNIAIGTSGTTTAATTVFGIRSAATGTTVSLGNTTGTGNTIQNMSSFGSSTSSLWFGIQNTGAAGTINENYNTFTANTLAGGGATSMTIYYAALLNSGAVTTALNVNNNAVNSGTISIATYAGTSCFVFANAGGASSTVSIQNNIFAGLAFTGTSGSTGSFYGIYHTLASGSVTSKNVSSNAFTNLTLKTSGQVILIYVNDVTQTMTVSGNSIGTQFTRSVSSDAGLYGIFSANATGATAGTHVVNNNNFSNITSATTSVATTGVVGIIWQPGNTAISSPTVTLSGNTIQNHSNSSTAPAAGIIADWSNNLTISGNVISDLSTAGPSATGIQSAVIGTTSNVFKNRVYDLSTTTNAAGISTGISVVSSASAAAAATYNIYNNLIGNLLAPSSSGTNQVIGVSTDGPSSARTHNIYYNTIYLNAAGGANFGSSAVSVSTTPTITMRNNVLVNLSTPSGTGLSVAYRRSSTSLTTYGSTSNNNDFYAGTPGATRLIFYDGTNSDQTLAAYKTRVASRDSASFSENPPFLSTTGSNANFLHIDPAISTLLESHAANIAGITDDFDGDTRQGNPGYSGTGTAPDVGADEFAGMPASTNATLSNLTLSAGTLVPPFASGTISYTASVPNATSSITVTPTASNGFATIQVRVNGGAFAPVISGQASAPLALSNIYPGVNTVDVKVTAQDTTTVITYTVTVTRRATQLINRNGFGATDTRTYGDSAYGLDASATSGLPVSYSSSNTTVATISGNTLTIVGTGSTTITASQPGNNNYDPATDVTQALTVNRKALSITANSGQFKIKGASDPTFTYQSSGLVTGDSINGALSRAAGEAAGSYAITQGTITNTNNPNYDVNFISAQFFIAGPLAASDEATRPSGAYSFKIPTATLIGNDTRIATDGTSHTDNLSITGVTSGSGNTVSLCGAFVCYTPDNPSDATDKTFTYTLLDSSTSTNDIGTVTVHTAGAQSFSLDIIDIPVPPSFDGTNTSATVDFVSVPNQNLLIEYSTNLTTWTSVGTYPSGNGSFAVTITAAGDHVSEWNAGLFFRATQQ